ncbi:MAG: hypothetical protein HFI63_06185 [Lachnospiraceae bacterium]|nr:hypothetical protein [Lachnospiraceae bacterium]
MEYLFFVVCLTAAVTDILWRRIPNIWLGSWFLTGLLLAGWGMLPISGVVSLAADSTVCFPEDWQSAVSYLGRAAAVSLILIPAWRLRMTGAGDVKLCSIMAAFMGLGAFIRCICYSLFFGSILSVFYMIRTQSFRRRMGGFLAWFGQCISCNRWVPYRKEQNMEGTIPFAPVLLAGYLLWWQQLSW